MPINSLMRSRSLLVRINWARDHGDIVLQYSGKILHCNMQHSAKGTSKVVKACTLPLTSARPIDLLVTEMAVIAFSGGQATLLETAPGVSVEQVLEATEAELDVPPHVPQMLW